MRQKINSISHWFRLPVVCIFCGSYFKGNESICIDCCALLTPIQFSCQLCCLPLVDDKFLLCGHCIRQKPAFDAVYCHYHYDAFLRYILHEYKYNNALYLRTFIVKRMLDALPVNFSSQCLVPVPIHTSKLKQRGFNQAVLLAKLLGNYLNIPVNISLCRKIKPTPSQVTLNRKQRRNNVKNTFLATCAPYEHITLVDDLLTTGATTNELAKIIKQQGVKKVDVWCLARTPN